ncbi:MAG: exodeoxyribonuclease VII large subunit [Halieaceae bacterium]
MNSETSALSVTELNRTAKRLLESHFDTIWVDGEISNFARPSSGHWYLTLKDERAQVRCAMFRNRNMLCRFKPENGQKVKLRARVSLYEGRGEFQLILEHIELAGDGALQAAFEQLKRQLQAEGLFDVAHKQPIPNSPNRVGLITSASGAALRDMISVFHRRHPSTELLIVPTRVQGDGAAAEMIAAIRRLGLAQNNQTLAVDAIIIGRGGGSMEDLWCFNSEALAREIFNIRIPVVSAVGHETDFTICDLVADQRAPTPSAAAELLSPNQADTLDTLRQFERQLFRQIRAIIDSARQNVDWLERQIRPPGQRISGQLQLVNVLEGRLRRASKNQLEVLKSRLQQAMSKMDHHLPTKKLSLLGQRCEDLDQRLQRSTSLRLANCETRLARAAELLNTVSPLATLQRGYSIVTTPEGNILRDAAAAGTQIKAKLASGSLYCTVDSIESAAEPST